jgi:hypothetical protein
VTAGADGEFVTLTGAYVPGKGWRGPEVAHHFAGKGAKFARFGPSGAPKEPVTTAAAPEFGPASDWSMPLVKKAGALASDEPSAERRLPLFALSHGPADPQPRRARAESVAAPVYRRAVADLLRDKGRLSVAAPRLTQNLRVDLDGDGTDEVLLVANSPLPVDGDSLPKGGYTAVVLRHVGPGGRVWTVALGLSTPLIEDKYNLSRGVLACVDIDGDGRLEVVTYATQYESEVVEVWAFDGKAARRVLETGWGV